MKQNLGDSAISQPLDTKAYAIEPPTRKQSYLKKNTWYTNEIIVRNETVVTLERYDDN